MGKKKCFVIMPISSSSSCTEEEWTGVLENIIKPAVKKSRLGYTCERAKPRTGNLIGDILSELNTADLVIADLTDRNPNVFYELGVRHTLRNRTILIAQDLTFVPSDLQSYWTVTYKKGIETVADSITRLANLIREIENNPDKPDNPVADFLSDRNISLSEQERSANTKKLTALLSELSYNLAGTDRVLATLEGNRKMAEAKDTGYKVSVFRFENACLNLLCSTSYIVLPEAILKRIWELNGNMSQMNSSLDLWSNTGARVSLEVALDSDMSEIRTTLTELVRALSKVRIDYINNNFQEEAGPAMILAMADHQDYVHSVASSGTCVVNQRNGTLFKPNITQTGTARVKRILKEH